MEHLTGARECSLNNGLSVPIYISSGDQAAGSFGGRYVELSNADLLEAIMKEEREHARADNAG